MTQKHNAFWCCYLKDKQLLEAVFYAIASILVLLLLVSLHHYKGIVLELVLSINKKNTN